jgi:hypothetical protein
MQDIDASVHDGQDQPLPVWRGRDPNAFHLNL